MEILDRAHTYHAYIFSTSFWYFLRGIVRVIDPATVCDWFRPPTHYPVEPNDLELYTTRVDAWGLLALSAVLLVLSDAVPLPAGFVGSSLADHASSRAKKPYARAVVVITILHHVLTGIGSFQHWVKPTHRTVAMDIGVFGNIGLTVLGLLALFFGLGEKHSASTVAKKRA